MVAKATNLVSKTQKRDKKCTISNPMFIEIADSINRLTAGYGAFDCEHLKIAASVLDCLLIIYNGSFRFDLPKCCTKWKNSHPAFFWFKKQLSEIVLCKAVSSNY